jgi:Pyoverdine/dityrosine biosynthesis protein
VPVNIASTLEFSLAELDYQAGLSKRWEAVISSHFMDVISQDRTLQPYTTKLMDQRAHFISSKVVDEILLPVLCDASRKFATERAAAALARARAKAAEYGLSEPAQVTAAEAITELMFDRQFSRKANLTRSRTSVRDEVAIRLDGKLDIDLVIPALPFKILCPLKARGVMPDFAEVDLILSLYEIAYAIELVSRMVSRDTQAVTAHFVVVSDGKRFASIVNVASEIIDRYRLAVEAWIQRLGLEKYVKMKDYWELLHERLPQPMLAEKQKMAREANRLYAEKLNPTFEMSNMERSLAVSRALEPDPEEGNPEGRFASLFKSLVYTVNYRVLDALDMPGPAKQHLYRELTSNIFYPLGLTETVAGSTLTKEGLRQAMIREVWQATIEYMAEIKSDRDLKHDPVLVCMPNAVRWTIHAKAGQFAIMTPSMNGFFVQAWAGSGLFRLTKKGAIQLCSYPVLGIEGRDAVPIFEGTESSYHRQPLFYIDHRLGFKDMESFAVELAKGVTRRRLL